MREGEKGKVGKERRREGNEDQIKKEGSLIRKEGITVR